METEHQEHAKQGGASLQKRRDQEAALSDISAQIDRLKLKKEEKARRNVSGSLLTLAYRLTIEMFAAISVCGYLGWWIDRYFETKPIFLLVLLFLGVVAGLMNAVRTATAMRDKADRQAEALQNEAE